MHSVRTAPWQSNNYKQYVNEIQDALRADSAVAKHGFQVVESE